MMMTVMMIISLFFDDTVTVVAVLHSFKREKKIITQMTLAKVSMVAFKMSVMICVACRTPNTTTAIRSSYVDSGPTGDLISLETTSCLVTLDPLFCMNTVISVSHVFKLLTFCCV